MSMKSKFRASVCLAPLCLLLILTLSCGSNDSYVGTYKATASDSPKQGETTMELKQNGDGVWKVGDDEIPFSWDVKGGELRVNTKGGGVIVGSLGKDTIRITLPGSITVSFKKVR